MYQCPGPTKKTSIEDSRSDKDQVSGNELADLVRSRVQNKSNNRTPISVSEVDPEAINGLSPIARIHFEFDSAVLSGSALEVLKSISSEVLEFEEGDVIFAGFTDSVGAKVYNDKLARRRSLAVAEWFTAKGLGSAAYTISASGKCCYIDSNETPRGRKNNRRVDVYLKHKEGVNRNKQTNP